MVRVASGGHVGQSISSKMMERPNYRVGLNTIEKDRRDPKLSALAHRDNHPPRTYNTGASYDVTSVTVYHTYDGPSDD